MSREILVNVNPREIRAAVVENGATLELFIERAASRSSTSGRAYRVRCPGQPETSSAEWFDARLKRLRSAES